jgi:hypothetical protein
MVYNGIFPLLVYVNPGAYFRDFAICSYLYITCGVQYADLIGWKTDELGDLAWHFGEISNYDGHNGR